MLAFLADTARPALAAVAETMRESGLEPQLAQDMERLDLSIDHGDQSTFHYSVRVRGYRAPSFAYIEAPPTASDRHYRAIAHSTAAEPGHDLTGYTGDQLIDDLLKRYARYRQAKRMS